MKLQGIRSSKGRRLVHARNRNLAAPADVALAGHEPTPQPDGSLKCSGCGAARYSPAAFAAHLFGRAVPDAVGFVFTTGATDPWVAQPKGVRQEQVEADAEAERRAEQVAAYYAEQRRPAPRIVEGVERWLAD